MNRDYDTGFKDGQLSIWMALELHKREVLKTLDTAERDKYLRILNLIEKEVRSYL